VDLDPHGFENRTEGTVAERNHHAARTAARNDTTKKVGEPQLGARKPEVVGEHDDG
jgi:hypothetical protein